MTRATRPTSRHAHARHAFSLMEMLVVIVIILGLVSLGAFALAQFRTEGKRQQTISVLQQAHSTATEYQATTGGPVNHEGKQPIDWTEPKERNAPGSSGTSNELADDSSDYVTIERFVWAANRLEESEQILQAINDHLRDTENDNTGDGFLEIVDSWGNPIVYRSQVIGTGDFLPPHPRPYFASAGADGEFGDATTGSGPNEAAEDNVYSFNLD